VPDTSNITGAAGEAVARRLYPAARRHADSTFDFVLPDGRPLEAKAVNTHGGLHFRGEQGRRLSEARVVVTLYDPRVIVPEHEPLLAVTRAVVLVVDAPGAWVNTLTRDYATGHVPAGVFARAAIGEGQMQLLIRLDIAPRPYNRAPRQTRMDYLPLITVPPDDAYFDLRSDRVRRGYGPPKTPF